MSSARTPSLELWQAEWCPYSHRVRQRLTELDLPFLARQVPADQAQREELRRRTGFSTVPVLIADGLAIGGEQAILVYLDEHFEEPPGAAAHRERATSHAGD
jgi:glutaredoxin 3